MPKHVRTLKEKRRQRILPILKTLAKKGQATAADLKTNAVEMQRAEQEKLVRRVTTQKTGKAGRPAVIWTLASNGRKRVARTA